MSKASAALVFLLAVRSVGLASSSPTEVLYVESHNYWQEQQALLYTYNVNPQTAEPKQIGSALPVPTTSIDPLTVNGKHVLYLWNGTDVWKYNTNEQGAPESRASQHLKFDFPHPVLNFLADPNGKFAYAGISWWNNIATYSAIVLFTIDSLTGDLTNTGRIVARYGPNYYVPITQFSFGVSGRRLYFFKAISDAPHSCGGEYDFYNVSQKTGSLGPGTYLTGWGDCGAYATGTFSDTLTSVADSPFGVGSGTLVVSNTFTGQTIECGPSMLSFCGDEPGALSLDPGSKNIFYRDLDTQLTYAAHINFRESKLLPTSSLLPGGIDIYFSPDSKLMYGINGHYINIYAFDPNTGNVTAGSFLLTSTSVYIASSTLGRN